MTECNNCKTTLKKGDLVYCGVCYVNKIWEISKLEELKKIVDLILERAKLDQKNPYNKADYEEFL